MKKMMFYNIKSAVIYSNLWSTFDLMDICIRYFFKLF